MTPEETAVLEEIQKDIAALRKEVGWKGEDQYGKLTGEGLVVNLARVDAKVTAHDNLYKAARYLCVGFLSSILAVWWLISDKVAQVLK
jgi:hypothetical protein